MIFCFVRETKQLTLEELDRKSLPLVLQLIPPAHMLIFACRGLLRADQGLHLPRNVCLAAIHHQALRLPPTDSQAAADYCEGGAR